MAEEKVGSAIAHSVLAELGLAAVPDKDKLREVAPDNTITHTVSAFFDGKPEADSAIKKLLEAGLTRSAITLSGGKGEEHIAGTGAKGFWDTLESLFFPDEDRHEFTEGLRRGGFLVTASGLTVGQKRVAADMLELEGSVDLQERSNSWRNDGWSPGRGVESDTSEFANSTYDNSDGTLVGGNVEDAFHSHQDDAVSANENYAQPDATALAGSRDADTDKVRVRSYTVTATRSDRL